MPLEGAAETGLARIRRPLENAKALERGFCAFWRKRMAYRHIHHAFLFEATVGLLSLLTVAAAGNVGVFLIALIFFRPFILHREQTPPDQRIWRLYYNALRIGAALTALSILATYGLQEIFPTQNARGLPFILVLPWFMLSHGIAGFVLSHPRASVR